MARFHRPTWTLVRGMESPKGNGVVDPKGDKISHPSSTPFHDDMDEHPDSPQHEEKITIAIFHPFTNKFTIKKLPSQMCVAEVLDCLEPPVPSTVPIVVEHNAKRLDLTVQLGQLPPKSTLRFRHYSGLGGMDAPSCLRTELLARGVPPKQVASRVSSVVNAIGEAPLREAFLQTDPWARVKEQCTSHNVRLILPSELKDHQQQRRSKTEDPNPNEASSSSSRPKGKGNSKGKGKGKNKSGHKHDQPVIPPWEDLTLPLDGFMDLGQNQLDFIKPSQLQREAQGVCPMNLSDAMAFVASHAASTLSSDPLAILAPGHLCPTKDLVIEHFTLPVVFRAEPILIPASLIQLGAQEVKYEFQGPNIKIDTTESTVIEVHLDSQRCAQWSPKVKPLDIIAPLIPGLNQDHQLIGHWSWKWLDENRKICLPHVATRLHGYLRVATSAVHSILGFSGPHGLSLWPKASNHAPCPLYSHIPVEANDEKQAQAIAQTSGYALGFVHTYTNKWMIRCKREDFPAARRLLLPHGMTIDAAAVAPDDDLYVLHPADNCPLSSTTTAMEKGLHDMGWKAKVIKPMGSLSWLIASDSTPARTHISINDHVCSIQPIEAFRARQSKPTFRQPPGLAHNPWAAYKPISSVEPMALTEPPKSAQGPTASRLDEKEQKLKQHLEQVVEQAVENKMQPVTSRFEQIENAVANTCTFHETRLTAVEKEVKTTNAAMQTLQQQISVNHQQSLQQMKDLFDSLTKSDGDAKRPRKDGPDDMDDKSL